MFPFGESVRFEALRVGADDVHGNPVTSYAAAVVVDGCAFAPGGSVESYQPGRNPVVSSPTVFVPAGTVVSSRDRCTVRGVVYEVSGTPSVWHSPYTGRDPGIVVTLERVDG